jgi:hypothetical protein
MPYGVTLSALRREFRAEAGISLNPQQGVAAQAGLDLVLARQQRELWDAYEWQQLHLVVNLPLAAGQMVYNYPPQMAFDQIDTVWRATGPSATWVPLTYGIPASAIPPSGVPPRGTPTNWANWATVSPTGVTVPVGQLAIMPAPSTDMFGRLEGSAPLNPLVADTDTTTLDSTLIALFCAAEYLATQKNEGAQVKLTKAQNYLRRLLSNGEAIKARVSNMGGNKRYGVDPDRRRMIPYMDYIPTS